MKTALKWISGIYLLIMAAKTLLFDNPASLGGLFYIPAALICLPPTLRYFEQLFESTFRSAVKYGIVIGCLLIGSVLVANNNKTTKSTISEPALVQAQKEPVLSKQNEIEERKGQTVSAIDLVQAFQDNEVRADENYKGKIFYVEGIVGNIKKDLMDNIYVTLKGSEMFREVQCYFNDKATASRLEKDMKVTFKGECDGLMMNVQMKNCKLVENLKDLK